MKNTTESFFLLREYYCFMGLRRYIEAFLNPFIVSAWLSAGLLFVGVLVISPDLLQATMSNLIAGIVGVALGFVITSVKDRDDRRRDNDEQNRRLFLGLYIELKHIHSFIEHIPMLREEDFPSLPRLSFSSYDVIRSMGLMNINDENHLQIEYVYRLLSNIDDQLATARILLISKYREEAQGFVKICKENISKVLKLMPQVFDSLELTYSFNPEIWEKLRDDWSIIRDV